MRACECTPWGAVGTPGLQAAEKDMVCLSAGLFHAHGMTEPQVTCSREFGPHLVCLFMYVHVYLSMRMCSRPHLLPGSPGRRALARKPLLAVNSPKSLESAQESVALIPASKKAGRPGAASQCAARTTEPTNARCMCVCMHAGALAGGAYDEDDRDADNIWDAVDSYMDERRRVRAHARAVAHAHMRTRSHVHGTHACIRPRMHLVWQHASSAGVGHSY